MKPAAILEELHSAGVMIEFREGGLRCRPKPTGRLLELIRANRVALAADLVATMTRTMPDDPAFRGKVHRLLDQANELDRAGDEAGAIRILDDIRQTIQNATVAQPSEETPRNGGAGKYGVAAVSTQPRARNAESSRNPVAVQTSGNVPAMPPPGERETVREVGPCGLCGGGRFWVSRWGVVNCMTCHPPADGKLIERNISIHV